MSPIKLGKLLINNEWCEATSQKRFDVFNPATEKKLTDVAEADAADVNAAVKVARQAFERGPWKKMSARERGRYLTRIALLLEKHKEEFAELETLNNGKPIHETTAVDIPASIETFE
jgi:aldehyde dehydrogenase (NAD+)